MLLVPPSLSAQTKGAMQRQFENVHQYIVDVVNSPLVPLVWSVVKKPQRSEHLGDLGRPTLCHPRHRVIRKAAIMLIMGSCH